MALREHVRGGEGGTAGVVAVSFAGKAGLVGDSVSVDSGVVDWPEGNSEAMGCLVGNSVAVDSGVVDWVEGECEVASCLWGTLCRRTQGW